MTTEQSAQPTRLTRQAVADSGLPLPAAPVRVVHIGVGAFSRAHQAWYTARADDSDQWGIAAFTGRRPDMAELLSAQDGLYTLVERGEDGDIFEVIGSLSEVRPGTDLARFFELIADPNVAVVTLTITEAGYKLDANGELDRSDAQLNADVDRVRGHLSDRSEIVGAAPETALVRLVTALSQRADAGAGKIAVVSCDNVMDNGVKLRRAISGVAGQLDPNLADWIDENVSFVSTSIDRITPRTDQAVLDLVEQETGFVDEAPVVTEPFTDWVLSGDFPAGRPAWETAGATFTDDIEPYELRKLWLLNGSHSLLAYMGLLEGHETVAQAMSDPKCRAAVEAWWDEACRHLPAELGLDEYREQLTARFLNPRIAHLLEQIGNDGLTKLRQRTVPVAKLERAAGRDASAAATTVAKWIVADERDFNFTDALEAELAPVRETGRVQDLVALIDVELGGDAEFVALVESAVEQSRQSTEGLTEN